MSEARSKMLHDAEKEIHRATGGSTEYLGWTGKSAALLDGVMAACKKLVELAEEQKRPFNEAEKTEFERLELFGDTLMLAAVAIEQVGATLEAEASTEIEAPPLAWFESLVRRYVAAHRVAYRLWRDREEYRLLSRPAPERPN
jgi:hypothetical protein